MPKLLIIECHSTAYGKQEIKNRRLSVCPCTAHCKHYRRHWY